MRTAAEEVDEREGKLPDVAWTTFPSWEAVGACYRGLEGERMQAGAEVKAKVAQVVAGKPTTQEKVQAVYAYVATQISTSKITITFRGNDEVTMRAVLRQLLRRSTTSSHSSLRRHRIQRDGKPPGDEFGGGYQAAAPNQFRLQAGEGG